MSATHTPGPWFHWRNSRDPLFTVSTSSTEGECDDLSENQQEDSTVAGVWLGNSVGPESEALAEANARLIAAAPRLKDACNGLLGLLELIAGRPDITPELKAVLVSSHRVQEGIAAVDEAEGRS